MAWIIEQIQKPALVIAHNKTLAAQLCNEFREFFPENAVEYFVSYYDYYQPEAYVPQADLYIEKDSSQNDDIARLRLNATSALFTRRDVVVVASVSCIYGLGSPEEWRGRVLILEVGVEQDRDEALRKLIENQYVRNDSVLGRGRFRVKGDVVEIQPANTETAYRISFFGDEVEQITHFDPLTGEIYDRLDNLAIWPATEYVTSRPTIERAVGEIRHELEQRARELESENKLLEAHRLRQRTEYDLEMMKELGFCNGIENYSRILEGRPPGSHPFTLLDYFPDDFVVFVDESHQTVPQIGGMYEGDRSRKQTLVDYGFRLPVGARQPAAALRRVPRQGAAARVRLGHAGLVRAAPLVGRRPSSSCGRPGSSTPRSSCARRRTRSTTCSTRSAGARRSGERTLVTTLTKKMAEDLTDYLLESGVKARYLHSEIDTLERIQIIRELRLGDYDVLVGVNLLREGLDLPEVSLVAVLDADKEGFLRGRTSLIQTIGRAARNVNGKVLLYADKVTAGDLRGDGRDRAAARGPARLQRGARDHARVDRQGRLGHRGVPLARVADRADAAPAREVGGRGHERRGAREARRHARGGDVRGRRGAPLRVRGQAARRDQGAAARAARCGPGARLASSSSRRPRSGRPLRTSRDHASQRHRRSRIGAEPSLWTNRHDFVSIAVSQEASVQGPDPWTWPAEPWRG